MPTLKAALRAVALFFKRLPLGYATEDFRHHHQLVLVWWFGFSWFEVYRWPVGTGSDDVADAMHPLPHGSSEAYHRLGFCAERVHRGTDFRAAKDAMCDFPVQPAAA